jgi:ssDNA-binding Zn-finger/Zn-ribbon topoisomerase 1
MAMRRNRHNDSEFLGCTQYPDCTETRPLPEDVKLRRQGAQVLPGFEL